MRITILRDDDIMKNIFNSGRCKNKVGMRIPAWMITKEMKLTEHYRMYAEVFGVDVPLTQSHSTGSTQGMHRIPSAPRSPNPKKDAGESSATKSSMVIRIRIPQRQSTRLTPSASVPTVDKAEEIMLQDTLRKLKRWWRNQRMLSMIVPPRNDEQNIPGPRLEPRSDKESPEVEVTKDAEVEIPNDVVPVNVNNDEEDEITYEVYELKGRVERKEVEESRSTPTPTTIRSSRTHINLDRYGYLFAHLRKLFLPRLSFDKLVGHLQEVIVEALPTMVDSHIQKQVEKQVPDQVKIYALVCTLGDEHQYHIDQMKNFLKSDIIWESKKEILESPHPRKTTHLVQRCQRDPEAPALSLINQDLLYLKKGNSRPENIVLSHHKFPAVIFNDDDIEECTSRCVNKVVKKFNLYARYGVKHWKNSHAKIVYIKTQREPRKPKEEMKFENLHVPQTTCRPSAVRPRDQDDHHDDAHPEGENSAKRQKTSEYESMCVWRVIIFMEELSLTIDEAKLKKMADEMLRQRCTSGDEHQHHIDQMKNFLKNDIVWETPTLSLINQDLLYLKKGSLGSEKIVLLLHKFPAIIFNGDDIEERTSRWVNKCVKKFNLYARYGVEHWKNPHAKIFYIRKQKEPGKPKEVIYSNSKIIQVIKTYWELVHEHKFITKIVARRANECIVLITVPYYKNLNKNDIEDMYLLIMNGKVPYYADTGIEEFRTFTIVYESVHGIIYKNSKKEKRVMIHSEIHKFCDAHLKRLKYRDQMRRWEMYVNGRPLGPRRERPE
ncbi:hypothetical protein Tco_0014656 [Tanacetum coccineum]